MPIIKEVKKPCGHPKKPSDKDYHWGTIWECDDCGHRFVLQEHLTGAWWIPAQQAEPPERQAIDEYTGMVEDASVAKEFSRKADGIDLLDVTFIPTPTTRPAPRDPRIDPRKGDVWRDPFGRYMSVERVQGIPYRVVTIAIDQDPSFVQHTNVMRLDEWQKFSLCLEIVKTAESK